MRMSFRSFWTVARSGLLLSLLLCVGSNHSSLLAQEDYAAMDEEKLAAMNIGDPVDPMTGAQQQAVKLTNRGSGIKRSENSLGRIQSLLYDDVVSVKRVNLNKIDYELLSAFVDEVVDAVGGSYPSSNQYLTDLREFQKSQAKNSFKKIASTVQNIIVKGFFDKKVDEIYFIDYADGDEPGCTIVAIPTDGLNADDQNVVFEVVNSKKAVQPIAIFKRFGFIIAVLKHDNEQSVDIEALQAKYEQKLLDAQKPAGYGSYTVSGNNSNAYGMTGASGVNAGISGGLGMGASNQLNDQQAIALEFQQELEKALNQNRSQSREKVLPFVRKRFMNPADSGESQVMAELLRVSDGAFYTVAAKSIDKLFSSSDVSQSVDSEIAQPFAVLSGQTSNDAQSDSQIETLISSLKEQNVDKTVQGVVCALSLVGSPKIVVVLNCANEQDANDCSAVFVGALALAKPTLKEFLNKKAEEIESDEPIVFDSFIDDLFTSIAPVAKGTKVGLKLDFDVLKRNAVVFRPLLGGKESKSQQELESESIDWSVAEEQTESAPEAQSIDVSTTDSNEETDEDDPFGSDDDDSSEEADEDDPFGSDDDPF